MRLQRVLVDRRGSRPNSVNGHQSLTDLAYQHLRVSILGGRLDSGAPIRQDDVADILGISRIPVREALRRLEVEGLVVLQPHRGYFVAPLSLEEINDVFETQLLLEEQAGYLATMRRTDEDVTEIAACLDKLDRILGVEPFDAAEFARYNSEFHERLLFACRRPYLCRMLRLLHDSVERYTRMGATLVIDLENSHREHHAIMDAFRAGDAAAVARLCRVHRENTHSRLLEHLKRAG